MKRDMRGGLRRGRVKVGFEAVVFSLTACALLACGGDGSDGGNSGKKAGSSSPMASTPGSKAPTDGDDAMAGGADKDGENDDKPAADKEDDGGGDSAKGTAGADDADDADAGMEDPADGAPQAEEAGAEDDPDMSVTGVMGGEEVVTPAGEDIVLANPVEAADSLAQLICGSARDCCREAGEGISGLVDCENASNNDFDLLLAVRKGFIVVDQAVLQACIAAGESSTLSCGERAPELGSIGFLVATAECRELLYGIVPAGGSCSWDEMCEQLGDNPVRCVPDADSGRVCRAVTVGEAGDSCVASTGSAGTTYVQRGGDDDAAAECRSEDGLWCTSQEGAYQCAAIAELGAACGTHIECGAEAYCDNKICASLLATGTDCLSGRQCESHFCDSDRKCGERIAPMGVTCRNPLQP